MSRPSVWLLRIPIILLACVICLLAFMMYRLKALSEAPPRTPPPVIHEVPDFTLTNNLARPFGLSDLRGRNWIADFIFTTCPTICPAMTRKMALLQKDFQGSEGLDFVSVSVNPVYDTPAILAQYAVDYGADTNNWHFLTGSLEAIQDLSVNGLKIGNKENPIHHSSYFVLVDRAGCVRGYYDSHDTNAMVRLYEDTVWLLDNPPGAAEG